MQLNLVPEQFSAATPENIMKAEIIHPQWDKYNFDLADKMVEYGKKHNILINGHTLIWHSQLPAFARNIKDVDSFKTFLIITLLPLPVVTMAKCFHGML
jgi:endo-1,4-beta-xylanase